jgi:hypothetical protein
MPVVTAKNRLAGYCQHFCGLVYGRGVDVQNHDPKAYSRSTDLAFGLVAETEGGAIAVVFASSSVNGTTPYSFRVPECNCNKSREPEYCVQGIQCKEGICVCESLSPPPSGDHDKVNDSGSCEETLCTQMSVCYS